MGFVPALLKHKLYHKIFTPWLKTPLKMINWWAGGRVTLWLIPNSSSFFLRSLTFVKKFLIFKIWTNFEYFDKPGSVERPQVHSQQVIIYSYRHFTRPCLLPRVTEPDPLSNNTFYAFSSHFYIFYKLTGDDLVLNMTFYDAVAHKNWREFANSVTCCGDQSDIYPRTHSNLN